MESRYSEQGEREYLDRYGARFGEDLALRVYTSRLLGQDPSLVLHGGGNTSVKSIATELVGDRVDVLYVKGSGWDLAGIEPAGFPACRLERLRRFARLDRVTDEQMVAELRGQMLDPSSPTPSVEALLHAIVPEKFVDHTHADAVLAVVDQPNSAEIVAEIWPDAVFLPYVMPGFVLAKAVREVETKLASTHVMVLDKHGIFTWGPTAKASYERMIEAVTAAERWTTHRRRTVSLPTTSAAERNLRRARFVHAAPILRGAIGRATRGNDGRDARPIVLYDDADDVLRLLEQPSLTQVGPATPDHVIRTKPLPMIVDLPSEASDAVVEDAFESALRSFAERYDAYVERCAAARRAEVVRLDRAPRVAMIPGLGALTLGATAGDAAIVRDVVDHTARVILDASQVGTYRPVPEVDLFDVEYWSLEQAKLKRGASAPRSLDRRIALVTGGAGGIGLATAEEMLAAGAHVALVDRDGDRLAAAAEGLKKRFSGRVVGHVADLVTHEGARSAVEACVATFGGLDVLVSNAGTAPTGLLHAEAGERALEESLRVNLLSHQYVARAATEVFLRQRLGGVLLFNASKSAFNQGPDFGPYAVAKTALVSLMRQYAVDLAKHGVRANAVNADRIRTGLFGGGVLEARAKARGVSVDDYFKANMLGRETTGADVARAFLYLATAEATTGCIVTVDGGNAAAFPR